MALCVLTTRPARGAAASADRSARRSGGPADPTARCKAVWSCQHGAGPSGRRSEQRAPAARPARGAVASADRSARRSHGPAAARRVRRLLGAACTAAGQAAVQQRCARVRRSRHAAGHPLGQGRRAPAVAASRLSTPKRDAALPTRRRPMAARPTGLGTHARRDRGRGGRVPWPRRRARVSA
jgi:hypothetical protein